MNDGHNALLNKQVERSINEYKISCLNLKEAISNDNYHNIIESLVSSSQALMRLERIIDSLKGAIQTECKHKYSFEIKNYFNNLKGAVLRVNGVIESSDEKLIFLQQINSLIDKSFSLEEKICSY